MYLEPRRKKTNNRTKKKGEKMQVNILEELDNRLLIECASCKKRWIAIPLKNDFYSKPKKSCSNCNK